MARIDLVIFDCDGVLLDSERLAVRTEVQVLAELGWPITEAEVVELFVGRSEQHMRSIVEGKLGRPVDWATEFDPRYRAAFEEELTPVDGVVDALERLTLPTCVASSSSHESLRFKLTLTGLHDRFAGRIFSADDVAHGKPAPDVFLLAATRLGADPSRCAVVEDSSSGIAAGLAAGMSVFAYTGGFEDHVSARADVVRFSDMRALPDLLEVA
jgi:HAD superfamily hydrolase (TIGR01509 family)